MSVKSHKETLSFQTEVQQLLHLMIHSLYSNKEIFLRELISNASDACDKLRFEALSDDALYEQDSELNIEISFDKENRQIKIVDNGIGMDRQEVIENIGTIAKSGTRQFMESLTGDQAKDSQLIGQFGVGFYSSFIVADKVTLSSRKAGLSAEHGVIWESTGEGDYILETTEKESRGTEILLHLKEDAAEFLDGYRLRNIIKKYSDHISLPIKMIIENVEEADKEADAGSKDSDADARENDVAAKEKAVEWETVNSASALWSRAKKDITAEEYTEFYKHVSHDFEDPMDYVHNHVEGNQSYDSLLFIPQRAPFDLWDRDRQHGIKLYVKRVFIMDTSEHLMPQYLRFVRGVIDSDDLPLNISREILQKNKTIDSIRGASVKKVLGLLEKMAKNETEKYAKFWSQFGRVLKEGPGEDFANKERISSLLRFSSTHSDSDEQNVSLTDYISRMKEGQSSIYYVTADSYMAAKSSPHLEVFKKKGIEVLLMFDRIDDWMMSYLTEFDSKKIVSVAKGGLELGDLEDKEEKEELEKAVTEYKNITDRMKEVLGEKVKEVRVSHRLVDFPSCIVVDENDMAMNLKKMLEAAGQDVPSQNPILEVNPTHPLIYNMKESQAEDRFRDLTEILYDQAMLSEGGQLQDPASFVKRMNTLLMQNG